MAEKNKDLPYYLISYTWCRDSVHEVYKPANEVYHGNIVDWFKQVFEHVGEKYVLLNYTEISKNEYLELYELVN